MEDIIFKRRSIRLFKKQEIPEEILRKILLAGMWAPSPKNRQPWKMIAALGKSKEIMLSLMKEGIDRSERGEGIITGSKEYIANAKYTMKCMAAAPRHRFHYPSRREKSPGGLERCGKNP